MKRDFNSEKEERSYREDAGIREKKEGHYSREGRDSSNDNYKGKRPRIKKAVHNDNAEPYFRPRKSRDEYNRDGEDRKRSFNPNFDSNNRLKDFNREDKRNSDNHNSYDRPRSFDRERPARPSFHDRNENSGSERPSSRFERPRRPFGEDRNDRGGDRRNDSRGEFRGDRYGKTVRTNNFRGKKEFMPKGGYDSDFKPSFYPSFDTEPLDEPVRLNKFIALSGVCSRREADELIAKGEITVNGEVITEMGMKVNPGDVVCHNGAELQGEKKVYILMNKPKGFVTSVDDPNAERTVMDIVRNACKERVYPVGRLDKNSLGVLIITNDGELTKKLTHPSHNRKKIYHIVLDRNISPEDIEKLYDGIELEDGIAKVDEVSYISDSKKELGITIHSGKNRIVRRIFEGIGYHVQRLDRVYMAGLTKKGLRRGAWRYLSAKEVGMLKSGSFE